MIDKILPWINLFLTVLVLIGGFFYSEGERNKETQLVVKEFREFREEFRGYVKDQSGEIREIRERILTLEKGSPR